jgi:hypothetical protein
MPIKPLNSENGYTVGTGSVPINVISSTGNISAANLNVSGTTNLGPVGNVIITGGTTGQYLQTNGSGALSWQNVNMSSANIANGTSNVNIPAVNGNVNTSVGGTANVLVVTNTGANVNGTIQATQFVSNVAIGIPPLVVTSTTLVPNLNVATAVTATTAGTVTTAAQPNITSTGTLTSLGVSGTIGTNNINVSGDIIGLTVNTRVIQNTFSGSDGLFVGYNNSNTGVTRLYGGGSTSNRIEIGNGVAANYNGGFYSGDAGVSTTISQNNRFISLNSLGGIGSSTAFRSGLEANGTNSAFMSFHIQGVYGTYLGLDTNNQLSFGGWSEGNESYRIWTEKGDVFSRFNRTYSQYEPSFGVNATRARQKWSFTSVAGSFTYLGATGNSINDFQPALMLAGGGSGYSKGLYVGSGTNDGEGITDYTLYVNGDRNNTSKLFGALEILDTSGNPVINLGQNGVITGNGSGLSAITGANVTGTVASSTNSTTAGGLAVHAGANNEANKIVRTDGQGHIYAGWIHTSSGDNGVVPIDRIYASNDSFIRTYTPINFRTVLDVPTRTGGNASGTWNINITGSISGLFPSNISNTSDTIVVRDGAGHVNVRVISNHTGTSPLNDGMFIGYDNSNSGVTRIFGGGSITNFSYMDATGVFKTSGGGTYWTADNLTPTNYISRITDNGYISANVTAKGFNTPNPSYDYTGAGLEVREAQTAGISQTTNNYAPAMCFHWANKQVMKLEYSTDGVFSFVANNNNTNYNNASRFVDTRCKISYCLDSVQIGPTGANSRVEVYQYGGIEITKPFGAFIDFKDNETEDYDYRIQNFGNTLAFSGDVRFS